MGWISLNLRMQTCKQEKNRYELQDIVLSRSIRKIHRNLSLEQTIHNNAKSKELKELILNNQIEVINLKLTADGRLIDTQKEDYTNRIKEIESKQYVKDNILYKRYSRALKDAGVDLVGAFYVLIGNCDYTKDNIVDYNIKPDEKLDYKLNILLENPEQFFGYFNSYKGYQRYSATQISKRGESKNCTVRLPVLILHKNGELRASMFYEVEYDNIKFIFGDEIELPSIEEFISNKQINKHDNKKAYPQNLQDTDMTNAYRTGYRIISINSDGRLRTLDLKSYLSKNESVKLAKCIINSDVHYWVGANNTTIILQNLAKKAEKYVKDKAKLDKLRFVANSVGTYGAFIIAVIPFIPLLLIWGITKDIKDMITDTQDD